MRTDANQIAFAVVRAILDAAKPLTLDIAGTQVTVAVSRDPAVPWPERGLPGVEPQTGFLAAVRAECSWPGGKVTLLVDCMQSRSRGYEGDVCLRVARGSRWLVMSDVKVALDDAADGQTVLVVARSPLIKRGAGVTVQPELNRALSQLLSTTALPIPSRGKVEIARVRLPTGTVETGADTAFLRLVLLALCKLDLADREGAAARGVPLMDVGQLGLSPAALAALESSDTEEENGDENDDTTLGRLRRRAARLFPDPTERQAALELMAYAVENAHDEKPSGWYTHDRNGCMALCAGRLLVCRLSRGWIELSVMGPISADVRATLGAEVHDNEVWKAIPGGLLLVFPVGKASVALEHLRDAFDRFVNEAMMRMRRRIDPDSHVPEVVTFLAEAVGRALPQPDLAAADLNEANEDDREGDEVTPSRDPRVRGRAPIFEHSQRSIDSLMNDVERGVIALPDLQRPFVWEDTRVRDLLDSLFVGFPVGTVVLWHVAEVREAHTIGRASEANHASALVIDGQQRLTSLFAVVKGAEVIDKDGGRRQIKIAFRPRDGRFEVPDAAIRQDPEFVADVSELWSGKRTKGQIRKELLAGLREKGREIDEAYEEAVEHNLDRVQSIRDFRFPVVDIRKTAQSEEASEEDVAEIFVRINNQGMRLGQADFVLTLLVDADEVDPPGLVAAAWRRAGLQPHGSARHDSPSLTRWAPMRSNTSSASVSPPVDAASGSPRCSRA